MSKPSIGDVMARDRRDAKMDRVMGRAEGRVSILEELIEHFGGGPIERTWAAYEILNTLRGWLADEGGE